MAVADHIDRCSPECRSVGIAHLEVIIEAGNFRRDADVLVIEFAADRGVRCTAEEI